MELLCHALCRDDDDDEDDIAEVSGRPKEIDQQARVPTIMFVQTDLVLVHVSHDHGRDRLWKVKCTVSIPVRANL